MDVCFYGGLAGQDMEQIGCDTGVASGTPAEINWPGLQAGTLYNRYAVVDDGLGSTPSPTWTFTTQEPVSVPALHPAANLIAVLTLLAAGTVMLRRRP